MPKEDRYITFELEEIHKAISIRCLQLDMELPPRGNPTAIEIDEDDPENQDKIFMKIMSKDKEEKLHFDRTFFALALVFFCQGCGIPLPKGGTKTLKIQENKIVMYIELKNKKYAE